MQVPRSNREGIECHKPLPSSLVLYPAYHPNSPKYSPSARRVSVCSKERL